MKTQIQSYEVLSLGTKVRVGNKRGLVVASELVNASNGGKIALNVIRFTESFKRGFGHHGQWEEIKSPTQSAVNYSFIELL